MDNKEIKKDEVIMTNGEPVFKRIFTAFRKCSFIEKIGWVLVILAFVLLPVSTWKSELCLGIGFAFLMIGTFKEAKKEGVTITNTEPVFKRIFTAFCKCNFIEKIGWVLVVLAFILLPINKSISELCLAVGIMVVMINSLTTPQNTP